MARPDNEPGLHERMTQDGSSIRSPDRTLDQVTGGITHQRWLLFALAFSEGAAVMITELTAAKMLAPLYGSSLYVWGAVIGVTLLSLTAGYYLGGLLSRRPRRREILYWCLLTAALLIMAMPGFAHYLMESLADELRPIPAILLQTLLYMSPPLLLLGTCPPLIIALLARQAADAGRMAGTVFAISTVGGILATFAGGFYLIPEFGLSRTAAGTGLALAVLPLLLLLGARHYAALAYPALALLLLTPDAPPPLQTRAAIVYQSEGLLGQVKVVDMPRAGAGPAIPAGTDRVLFVNRMGQTWIDRDSGRSQWGYVNYLISIGSLLPEGSRVLMLGLGGGVIARQLQELGHVVDSVELDARIAEVAVRYFGLHPNGELIIDDGRHYIRSTQQRYDLVILDVYQADIPPGHLLNFEAFSQLQALLNPGGFFVINYPGFLTGSIGYGGRSIYRTLLEAGYEVHILPTAKDEHSGNNLYIAAPKPGRIDFSRPRMPLFGNGAPIPLTTLFLDPARIDLQDAMVLRDNRPVLEKLSLEAAASWREGYYRHFTKPFLDLGIPLFE